ncbi:hypothetical protein UWK_01262 [Desulfocapsa sulfexigens DSM 10523]|uniref:HD/PDEase domain-containing protein n=1 Tax=Desulfocapsa sulfexigens (strain DSM 10523 / SB164P1) TaxID=1167006 RepID=M1PDM4_DESSD|nr:hypothetical protein [Desulfocapsa sulfexigens]AGF77825.1 hypothetical protein UWK_01262 [Desulfocapsa sulfexigens DSM 10523]
MDNLFLTKLLESGYTEDPLDEILAVITLMAPDFPQEPLVELHREIRLIFEGEHPEYRQSNTKYHNLNHTYGVVLATVRLFHGLSRDGWHVSEETLSKALYSAYFHDCGLLLKNSEDAETGAVYTLGHEKRSMFLMADYLKARKFSLPFITDCSLIIQCTNLSIDPDSLFFPSAEMQLASFSVGSADILAQMADRYYLERLPLLFQEHEEGGVTGYKSAVELMEKTSVFYHEVVVDRLSSVFGNLTKFMQIHFRERWGVDRNLYLDSIKKNVTYIRLIVRSCGGDMEESLQKYLRRIPPD